MRSCFLFFFLVLGLVQADNEEWSGFLRIQSETGKLTVSSAAELLGRTCKDGISTQEKVGLICTIDRTANPLADFADIVRNSFVPQTAIYGHFLTPESEDAVVSGLSEGEGTMLLTKREGHWIPVWYRSAVVTRSCRKVAAPNGRELLLCQTERGLFSVDLTHPVEIRESMLAPVDIQEDRCSLRWQEIDRAEWVATTRRLKLQVLTHVLFRPADGCGPRFPERTDRSVFEFQLTDSGFRTVGAAVSVGRSV